MASYELNGSNISVTIEDAMQLSVNVGESAALEVGQAINYIQSGRAELQPLVIAAAQSANNAETSAQNASDSATAALGYAERAETAAETAENMADKDLSNLSETGEARFAEKADDDAVVHLTGNETITGTKTLDGVLRVTDDQKLIGLSGSLIKVQNGTKSSWLTEGFLQFYDDGVVTELSKTSFKLNNSEISATGIVSTAINKSNALITSGGVYTALANKQDALVSGENIKTINGQSVLGDGNLVIASVTSWGNITGTLSAQTDLQTALNAKANTADIPTATSDLTNDSGYITLSALNGYATENWVENKGYLTEIPAEYVTDSELTAKGYQTAADVETAITAKGYTTMSAVEAKGYITNAALVGYATESYVTTALNTGLSGKQDTISDLETIRSGASAGATAVQPSDLATVATSGSYNDLSNKPTIPAAQVNSDWNATSGVAQILNKPSLATVATTGAYSDLSGTPSIPTVNNATLTITQGGVSKGTFTANASSDVTIALDAGGGGGSYTAGTGIDITNGVISIKYDNSSIKVNASGQLMADLDAYTANEVQTLWDSI